MPYFSGPNGIREVADPGERFTQAFKESRLARLYGDYFKTGNADLGQLARFDHEGAAKIKAEQERTGLAALLGNIYEAPDDQRQSLIAEAFRKDPTLGMNAAKMFDPRFNKTQAEQFTLTPGSARYGPDGKLIVSQPYEAKPQAATFQKDAEGNGWWLRPGEAPIPADAASMPDSGASAGLDQPGYGAADFSDPNSFYAAIGNAIAPHNGRITSTTGGQHNPGSLHPGGGAVDVGMGRETPEQQAAILAALQKDPRWLVRDERTRPQGQAVWGGPHLHVERRGGGSGGGGRINFGKADAPAEDKAANWQIVQGQDGMFYRVNKLTNETKSTGVQGANALRANDQHQKRAEAVAGIKGAITSTDQTIQQIDLLLNHPGRGSGTGMSAMFPAIPGSDRKGFDAQLATFKAQTFIPMVSQLKGMGALSDAEGKKLTEAVGALDPQMGEQEFADSLNRIKAQLYRAQKLAYDRITSLNTNQAPQGAQQPAPANGGFRILPD